MLPEVRQLQQKFLFYSCCQNWNLKEKKKILCLWGAGGGVGKIFYFILFHFISSKSMKPFLSTVIHVLYLCEFSNFQDDSVHPISQINSL